MPDDGTRRRTVAPLYTWRSAICDSDLSPTVRHVALTLSLYMNEMGGSAYPGAERLARNTGLAERTVRRDLGQLVEAGWLRIEEHGGLRGKRRTANRYVATTPASHAPVDDDPCISERAPLHDSAATPAHDAGHVSKNNPRPTGVESDDDAPTPDWESGQEAIRRIRDERRNRQRPPTVTSE